MLPDDVLIAFKQTLILGGYNLLFGSGISTDSTNLQGQHLRTAEKLREDLCAQKTAKSSTSLSRVYGLLSEQEKNTQITQHYSCQTPGSSVFPLSNFLWNRIFTFNVDDVVERVYEEHQGAKQVIKPINFNASFETVKDRSTLLSIHLHGYVREANSGFVFSYPEYAQVMKAMNPWMHTL